MLNRSNLLIRLLLLIPTGIYWSIVSVRNWLYARGIFSSVEFDLPVICVGNIAVGGTGKTPHVEHILRVLNREKISTAVISRGYKRKTKGYLAVKPEHTALEVGDEPRQISRKFPAVPFVVCENRVLGIQTLRNEFSETRAVVMDDGFQHRSVKPGFSIILTDFNNPIYEDYLLPLGNLRESRSQLKRANVVVVTKCPPTVKPIDLRIASKRLGLYPYQKLYFTTFEYGHLHYVWGNNRVDGSISPTIPVMIVAGIAKPQPFVLHVKGIFINLTEKLFSDHYVFEDSDISEMVGFIETHSDAYIITTEKDSMRLASVDIPEQLRSRFLYIPIEVRFLNSGDNQFNKQIVEYVTANKRNGIIH